jgi:hypothetical protein
MSVVTGRMHPHDPSTLNQSPTLRGEAFRAVHENRKFAPQRIR